MRRCDFCEEEYKELMPYVLYPTPSLFHDPDTNPVHEVWYLCPECMAHMEAQKNAEIDDLMVLPAQIAAGVALAIVVAMIAIALFLK